MASIIIKLVKCVYFESNTFHFKHYASITDGYSKVNSHKEIAYNFLYS